RKVLLLLRPVALPLVSRRHPGGDREALGSDLDGSRAPGEEIVEPGRVRRAAGVGGEDDDLVPVGLKRQRVDPRLAALGAGRVQQQDRDALEAAAHLAGVRPELLDDLRVPVVEVRHRTVVLQADHRVGTAAGAPRRSLRGARSPVDAVIGRSSPRSPFVGILGETYIPLLTQSEVWRTVDGGESLLEAMTSEHRAAVLRLLERIAPVLYAEWVNDLLLGHYPRAEVLDWLEAQPLVRRLRKLRCHECGWSPRVLDLLDQVDIWR